jgi:prolyl-tRNA editing enzyme YbaK/EbsC (Cys-tRNA(Pro) deacylase)
MSNVRLGDLDWSRALDHAELMAPTTYAALLAWSRADPEVAGRVYVAPSDPELADTASYIAAYHIPIEASVNCVVVLGSRAGEERIAAAAIRADTRADVNHVIKRLLDVRKLSFMGIDDAVGRTGMEYGGITPIGLPAGWRVLVDARAAAVPAAIIGSGIRGSKLLLPGALLARSPGASVVDGLAYEPAERA